MGLLSVGEGGGVGGNLLSVDLERKPKGKAHEPKGSPRKSAK